MRQPRPLIAAALSTLSCLPLAAVVSVADARGARHVVSHRSGPGCAPQLARGGHPPRSTHDCHASAPRPAAPHRSSAHQRSSAGHVPPLAAPRAVAPARPAVSAATIATELATPCQNSELTPEAANLALVRAAVLCLINRERAEHGEQPLVIDPRLEAAAEEHSQELVALDYFAHIAPNGTTPVDRARASGYIPNSSVGYVIGENLAWGTLNLSTPQSIVAAWIASPGHLANILESQYEDTGIGVVAAVPASLSGGQPGATYAQEFGVIIS